MPFLIAEYMQTKIAVIGVGGRTGTMFAQELQGAADVYGVGKEKEVNLIKEKKVYIEKNGSQRELFRGRVISDNEFPGKDLPDIIFLATKNPVGPAVRYYYQKIRDFSKGESFPALVLSQNGIVAGEDGKKALKEVLGNEAEKVQILRVSLFNPIEKKNINEDKICINYFLPIRLAFGVFSGSENTNEIEEIFKKANIEAQKVLPENVKNMEFSKLFSNLIGIASATKGLSIEDGFKNKETFKEEINILREYIKVVRGAQGNFLNLSHFPISSLAFFIEKTPLPVLELFRKKIGKAVSKGRGGKPKGNLDEIDYYIGEVIKLGEELKINTSFNQEIFKRKLKIY